ncbi:hypothetical protein BGZ60DRAFT_409512, partial [Tricladium varicosporioides]
MMNNMTLYPAHSDAQVAHAANAYLLLILTILYSRLPPCARAVANIAAFIVFPPASTLTCGTTFPQDLRIILPEFHLLQHAFDFYAQYPSRHMASGIFERFHSHSLLQLAPYEIPVAMMGSNLALPQS